MGCNRIINKIVNKVEVIFEDAEPNCSEDFKTNSERLLRKFVAEADFIDFTTDVGVNGWGELDKWIENNIKNKK